MRPITPDDPAQAEGADAAPTPAHKTPKNRKTRASDAAPPRPADLEKSLQAQHLRDLKVSASKHKLEVEARDAENRRRIELMMSGGIFLAMAFGLAIPFMPGGDGQKIAGGIVASVVTGCMGYLAGRHGGGKA